MQRVATQQGKQVIMANGGRSRAFFGYVIAIVVLAIAAAAVFQICQQKDAQLSATREALAVEVARGPSVQVVPVTASPKERLITLLGDTRPWESTTLYGKVSGYVKSIPVDRGDHVSAGQVVVEVQSPETDRQYDSAVADLENKR